MIDKLEKLFSENKLKKIANDKTSGEICFHREGREYFLIKRLSKVDFISFFECEKINNLINYFDKLKSVYDNAEKNTSLIIFVEVDNIEEEYNSIENQILTVEEDEYFFRKYVIAYNKDMIKDLPLNNITNHINKCIENRDIDKFRENQFEDSPYFFAIQLFVKLPFLTFTPEDEEFHSIKNILNEKLLESNLQEVDKLFEEKKLKEEDEINLFLSETADDDELFKEYEEIIK